MKKLISTALLAASSLCASTVTYSDTWNSYGLATTTTLELSALDGSGNATVSSGSFTSFDPSALRPYVTGLSFHQGASGLDVTWNLVANPLINSVPTAHFDGFDISGYLASNTAVSLTVNRDEVMNTASAAPEPATWSMLGLGLAGVITGAWRRKKVAA